MAHELAGALQHVSRIRQRRAVKETHVYVRMEYIDVAEGRVSQTCNRAAVMQKLPDFVPAFSHHLKPLMRDGSQFTCVLFHPRIDGGIPRHSAVELQQFRSHRRSTFFEIYGYVTPYTRRPLACRARRNDKGYFLSNARTLSGVTRRVIGESRPGVDRRSLPIETFEGSRPRLRRTRQAMGIQSLLGCVGTVPHATRVQ